jgi:hypothetical protein
MKTYLPGDKVIIEAEILEIRKTKSGDKFQLNFQMNPGVFNTILLNKDELEQIIKE